MIGVAGGLRTIHNPESSIFKRHDKRAVGFHFDLKPANILITEKGELKISDFGLSLIKRVSPNGASYGIFRGGAPRYQAPEVSPVQHLSDHSSGSLHPSTIEDMSDEVKNKYDVWSYACIVLEVMIYLFEEDGKEKLKQFENSLDNEPPGRAFHGNGKLKSCVRKAMDQVGGHAIAGSEGPGYDAWADDMVEFLSDMFHFQPEYRPSSTDVFEKLHNLFTDYRERPDDEIGIALMKFARQDYPKEKYDQVYWRTPNATISFIKMLV